MEIKKTIGNIKATFMLFGLILFIPLFVIKLIKFLRE